MEQCGELGIRTWYSSLVSGTPQGLRFESLTGVMGWSQRIWQELWVGSRGYGFRVRGYDRNYRGGGGLSQVLWGGARGYGVRARKYDRNYGGEPEDMESPWNFSDSSESKFPFTVLDLTLWDLGLVNYFDILLNLYHIIISKDIARRKVERSSIHLTHGAFGGESSQYIS